MALYDRLLAQCAYHETDNDTVGIDVDSLLLQLLLFERVVTHSYFLRELPAIVDIFGYAGFIELLKTGALRFHAFRLFAGNLEGVTYSLVLDGKAPAQHGDYQITNIYVGNPREEYGKYLEIVETLPNMSVKQQRKLKEHLAPRLVKVPTDYGSKSTKQTHTDLDEIHPGLKRAIAELLSLNLGRRVLASEVELRVRREDETRIHVESNLGSAFAVPPDAAHAIVGNAILTLDRLNVRLEQMELCSAMAGARPDETFFLEEKLAFLQRALDPSEQVHRFDRLVEILNLPDLKGAFQRGDLDAERFLEVRSSPEGVQFRRWLRDIDDSTDVEIADRVRSLRARLGSKVQAKSGRAVRLAASTAAGLIPVVGSLAGAAVGALDSFLIDKLLPEDKAIAFVSDLYPSIFSSDVRMAADSGDA